MSETGKQIGEVSIGTKHESVEIDGHMIRIGDIVSHDARDLNPYLDLDDDRMTSSQVVTGVVDGIYDHDGSVELSIENAHIGRIDVSDIDPVPDRIDRFVANCDESDGEPAGCIIETWYAATPWADSRPDEEYSLEVR